MAQFNIHFLNVGHGDCIIIDHPSGRLSVVDINNGGCLDEQTFDEVAGYYTLSYSQKVRVALAKMEGRQVLAEAGYGIELTDPIKFLQTHYAGRSIFRFILTHPHMDHMRGLRGLADSHVDIHNFWDTEHDIEPDLEESDRPEWEEYQNLRNGKGGNRVLRLYQGMTGVYYNQDPENVPPGDGISILHPTPETVEEVKASDTPNANNLSYVLKVVYGGKVFILGGDAETDVWEKLAKKYGSTLRCQVLKASHHGRDSGFCEEAVRLMSPIYTIVSVGKKPESDASNKYRNHSKYVWSTRWMGNINFSVASTGEWSYQPQYER